MTLEETTEEIAAKKQKNREKYLRYRAKNLERLRAKDREKYARTRKGKPTPEADLLRMQEYRKKNKEVLRIKQNAYNARNTEKVKDRKRVYNAKNKEKMAAAKKAWAATNKEKVRSYMVAYRRDNKERIAARKRELYHTSIANRLSRVLRNRLGMAIRRGSKAGSAVRDLGCSIPEFIEYIRSKFGEGMSWDNWGEWHLDHVRPLAAFDLSDREQFLVACNYRNIQPLWGPENISKGSRVPDTALAEPTEQTNPE